MEKIAKHYFAVYYISTTFGKCFADKYGAVGEMNTPEEGKQVPSARALL